MLYKCNGYASQRHHLVICFCKRSIPPSKLHMWIAKDEKILHALASSNASSASLLQALLLYTQANVMRVLTAGTKSIPLCLRVDVFVRERPSFPFQEESKCPPALVVTHKPNIAELQSMYVCRVHYPAIILLQMTVHFLLSFEVVYSNFCGTGGSVLKRWISPRGFCLTFQRMWTEVFEYDGGHLKCKYPQIQNWSNKKNTTA